VVSLVEHSIEVVTARIARASAAAKDMARLEAFFVEQGEATRSSDLMSAAYHLGSARVRALYAVEAWQHDLAYLQSYTASEMEAS